MSPALTDIRAALAAFTTSASTFQVLFSIPQPAAAAAAIAAPPPKTLYVLDSSFNPPTRAHMKIASSALAEGDGGEPMGSRRLILLMATQNADKAPRPAPFEHRIAMMARFAHDLRAQLASLTSAAATRDPAHPTPADSLPAVDVAVTKHPYFHDKAHAIDDSPFYYSTSSSSTSSSTSSDSSLQDRTPIPQVHLIGYDTLIRIFDPRYYPPAHTLAPLAPFLGRHRLRATYRANADWGGRAEQDAYVRALREGEREAEGGRREWAERIRMVPGIELGGTVSSTRAREAARRRDWDLLREMVPVGVEEWVRSEGLYAEDDE